MFKSGSRRVPGDILIAGLLVAAMPLIASLESGSILRFVVAIPALFFAPGYLVSVLLFPTHATAGQAGHARTTGITSLERAALSFGLSVAAVPIVAGMVWWFDATIGPTTLGYFATIILAVGFIGWLRRMRVPAATRYNPGVVAGVRRALATINDPSPSVRRANVVVLVAIAIAVASLTLAVAAPQQGEQYTSVSLGTVEDGEFVLGGYPMSIEAGDETTFDLLIANHEGEEMSYTIEAQLQEINDGSVVEVDHLSETTVDLADGEQAVVDHNVSPTMTGTSLRLEFAIYGTNDDEPRETVHLWLTVDDAEA